MSVTNTNNSGISNNVGTDVNLDTVLANVEQQFYPLFTYSTAKQLDEALMTESANCTNSFNGTLLYDLGKTLTSSPNKNDTYETIVMNDAKLVNDIVSIATANCTPSISTMTMTDLVNNYNMPVCQTHVRQLINGLDRDVFARSYLTVVQNMRNVDSFGKYCLSRINMDSINQLDTFPLTSEVLQDSTYGLAVSTTLVTTFGLLLSLFVVYHNMYVTKAPLIWVVMIVSILVLFATSIYVYMTGTTI